MIFASARCSVTSCPANKGGRGVTCAFAGYGRPCRHPVYRGTWAAAHELERALEANGARLEKERATNVAQSLDPIRLAARDMAQDCAKPLDPIRLVARDKDENSSKLRDSIRLATDDLVPIPAQPARGLTSRAMVANTAMDADRARQLALSFDLET